MRSIRVGWLRGERARARPPQWVQLTYSGAVRRTDAIRFFLFFFPSRNQFISTALNFRLFLSALPSVVRITRVKVFDPRRVEVTFERSCCFFFKGWAFLFFLNPRLEKDLAFFPPCWFDKCYLPRWTCWTTSIWTKWTTTLAFYATTVKPLHLLFWVILSSSVCCCVFTFYPELQASCKTSAIRAEVETGFLTETAFTQQSKCVKCPFCCCFRRILGSHMA